jgi:uncharacterized protein (TIGR02453 family)
MNAQPILSFLRDLKQHNNRDWFQNNRPRYDEARLIFQQFVERVIEKVADDEPAWANIDASKAIFRIYRDVRFSKNKDPYKTNIGANLTGAGKAVDAPGVYVAIEPGGQSMIAGGLYMPTPADLVQIRARLAADASPYRNIVKERAFKKHFPDGLNGDKSKIVRGFKPDHPDYDLILVKSHIAWRNYSDDEVCDKKFEATVLGAFRALIPLCRYIAAARVDPDASGRPQLLISESDKRAMKRKRA